ncbi:LysR substrate-binding domain-containing protein [Aeromonas caviae]
MSDEPSCSNVLDPQLPRCAWLLACSVSRKDASPQSSASARRIPVRILSGNGVHRFRNHCSTSPEYAQPASAARELALEHGFITLMPALAITRDLEFGRLVKLDVVDLPPDHWDVMMAWRSGKRPNPAKERVLEAARTLARRWSGKRT